MFLYYFNDEILGRYIRRFHQSHLTHKAVAATVLAATLAVSGWFPAGVELQ
jgi:hypothetical protein